MSDLPPADQPQGTPKRRVTRSRSRSSAARRARSSKPVTADRAFGAEDMLESQEDAALAETSLDDEPPNSDFEAALAEAREDGATPQKSRLTPLSKQILLWGAITAGIYLLFVLALTLFSAAFAANDAQARQNSAIVTPVACLSYLIPYALPFIAGWRATAREGLGRHGGLAAFWSFVLYIVVLELVQFVIFSVQGNLTRPTGDVVAAFAEGLVIQALISFAFGWFGGAYSSWQRKRAEQRQAKEAVAGTTVSPELKQSTHD